MCHGKITAIAIALGLTIAGLIWLWIYSESHQNRTKEPEAPDSQAARPADQQASKSGEFQRTTAAELSSEDEPRVFVQIKPRAFEGSEETPLATAVGRGRWRHFESRLNAIAALGTDLPAHEREELSNYLLSPWPEQGLTRSQEFALKNDILNKLGLQNEPPPELTDILLALRRDQQQPMVIRDYALQHLAPWYQRVGEAERALILDELEIAMNETDKSYAGTASLAWARIEARDESIGRERVIFAVINLLEDPTANLLARITAVQLAGRWGLPEAKKSVQAIAEAGHTPGPLRLAAIGTLSQYGGNPQPGFVQTFLETERKPHLRSVAQLALERAIEAAAQTPKQ